MIQKNAVLILFAAEANLAEIPKCIAVTSSTCRSDWRTYVRLDTLELGIMMTFFSIKIPKTNEDMYNKQKILRQSF
jgi:hypothetical protein